MNNVFSFILSPVLLFYIKTLFIILGFTFLIWTILLLLKNSWLKRRFLENWVEFFAYRPFGVKKTFKQWAKITKRLETGKEAECKLAVIEADKILDDSLKRLDYHGEDMGERLKQVKSDQLANIDELWQAHKVRNRIAHEPDFRLTQAQARRAIEIYQRAMQDLKAL